MEQPLNRETSQNQTVSNLKSNINRYIMLDRLDQCIKWLEQKAKQRQRPSSVKIHAMKGALHGYSIMLQGLKDYELDKIMEEIRAIKKHIGMT